MVEDVRITRRSLPLRRRTPLHTTTPTHRTRSYLLWHTTRTISLSPRIRVCLATAPTTALGFPLPHNITGSSTRTLTTTLNPPSAMRGRLFTTIGRWIVRQAVAAIAHGRSWRLRQYNRLPDTRAEV